MSEKKVTLEVWQDGICVASAFGPRAFAEREIVHYAFQYLLDGPVEIKTKGSRKGVLLGSREPENGA